MSKDRREFFARVEESALRAEAKLAAMPLEGHYAKQTTPLYKLSSRELKAAFGALAVTLIAVLAIVAVTAGDSNPPPAQGCINPTVAGVVGAETLNACGRKAVDICTHASNYTGARAETILGNCAQQGVEFTAGREVRVRRPG
jgi:hypothetical protein